MAKIAKTKVSKMEKSNGGVIPVSEFLNWWFDPKNGKINLPFTATKGKNAGKTLRTTGFHSVTSGFNAAVRLYYSLNEEGSLEKFYETAKAKKLISTRPVKMGFMVDPYREENSSLTVGTNNLAEMGLS